MPTSDSPCPGTNWSVTCSLEHVPAHKSTAARLPSMLDIWLPLTGVSVGSTLREQP